MAALAVAVVGVVVAGVFVIRWHRSIHRRLRRVVRSMSRDALVDVFIPDGLGGEIHIDHLLLTARGLLVMEVKDVRGAVFAGEKMDLWTAIQPNNRFTFDNPLTPMQDRVAAVTLLAPGVPIESLIVFTPAAEFPKGHPDKVTTLDKLLDHYTNHFADGQSDDTVFTAKWDQIKAVASAAGS